MKEARLIMGMPIEIEIVGPDVRAALDGAFAYLVGVDEQFSTYKETSEISRINRGELALADASPEMREVFAIGEKAKKETGGYFDIRRPDGSTDPSGVVKGWAIKNTAALVRAAGCENYFLNVGGDIAMNGKDAEGKEWSVGIRNPFKTDEIVKVVYPKGYGIATSGSYLRGDHIYNPHAPDEKLHDIVSITVIGPDVLAADLMATAAFAMGKRGIAFIENLSGFEGYAIDAEGTATLTSGFGEYLKTKAVDK
ncbi:MAG: thiamine biosynthesis protein [Parcubacteria group bacterium 21-58-10]|nr:MAG: thiamine biosynthesis protein [Parcubacteria group bacterium 21-58-10]